MSVGLKVEFGAHASSLSGSRCSLAVVWFTLLGFSSPSEEGEDIWRSMVGSRNL